MTLFRACFRTKGILGRWKPARIAGRLRYLVEQQAEAAAKATSREYVVQLGDRVVTRFTPSPRGVLVERLDVAAASAAGKG